MDKQEIKRRLEAAEKQNLGLLDEIKNLKAQLANMQDEPEIPDFPEFNRGSAYWSVDDEFSLQKSHHSGYVGEKGIKDDEALYNAFHTEEYAQEFSDKCKLIAMLLHCKWYICRDYHPDFNNGDIQKWTVAFNYNRENFTVEFSRMREWGTIYFNTEESAQKCANWLNRHWSESDD